MALATACDRATEPGPDIVEVFTPGNTFSPFTVTIDVGDVVRFQIFGDDHNVIFASGQTGAPADVNVVRDVTVDRTFTASGTFGYSCTVHPGMNGEVVVR
jgi:plastocyanin